MKFWHHHRWESYEVSCTINSPESVIRYGFSLRKCGGCGVVQKDVRGNWITVQEDSLKTFEDKAHKLFDFIKGLF